MLLKQALAQLNDTCHADRSIWYKPHVTGTVPRPRNNNATVYAENLGKMMFIGGWNGRNFIDDVDILSIRKYPTFTILHSLVPLETFMRYTELNGRSSTLDMSTRLVFAATQFRVACSASTKVPWRSGYHHVISSLLSHLPHTQ
jgi:hypothetical protein